MENLFVITAIIVGMVAFAFCGFMFAAWLTKDDELWERQVDEGQCPSKCEPDHADES